MIPISLLLALFLAFGIEVPESPPNNLRVAYATFAGLIAALGGSAIALGAWTAWAIRRQRGGTRRIRRVFSIGAKLLWVSTLGLFGWMIHEGGWPGIVLHTWGWQGSILIDDALMIAPFLLMQLLVWWGTFLGERALQGLPSSHAAYPVWRRLYLWERQSIALTLPIITIFVIRNDVIGRLWPTWQVNPLMEALELAALGMLVLTASPIFIRLAWPTRSLPDGPLRRRLEAVSHRTGFRCTDILVWDTNHMMVNACVTGVLPGFRYVLLSDALIDSLSPVETAAVFGHEVGHVAHRHLQFFLFFFLGCLAVMTMSAGIFNGLEIWLTNLSVADATVPMIHREAIEGLIVLAAAGSIFWVVFGNLSRRFERQADVYGCKVVSCGERDCPPHLDLEDEPDSTQRPLGGVCPVGVRIFVEALATVAQQNGIRPQTWSWRHGSIAGRIDFLHQLSTDPAREAAFQRRILYLRYTLASVLAVSLAVAGVGSWMGVFP